MDSEELGDYESHAQNILAVPGLFKCPLHLLEGLDHLGLHLGRDLWRWRPAELDGDPRKRAVDAREAVGLEQRPQESGSDFTRRCPMFLNLFLRGSK